MIANDNGTSKAKNLELSFELFPPKTDKGIEDLKSIIGEFEELHPEYISVTYGAGGSTREKTFEIIKYIKDNTNIKPVPHLTCVNAKKEEINDLAKEYLDIGVDTILALRGDPPNMEGKYEPYPGGYPYAHELVRALKEIGIGQVNVACFPETHPEADSSDKDLDYLKQKIDSGASEAVTQYCFDTDKIIGFVKKARGKGIKVPIVPGIMPIGNFEQIVNFSNRCGASVPKWLTDLFSSVQDDVSRKDLAIKVAVEQIKKLQAEGINKFHIYTLNKSELTKEICRAVLTT